MSGSIAYREIPANWQVPGSFAEVLPIRSGSSLGGFPVRMLIIGPAIPGVAVCNVGQIYTITSVPQADFLFGPGSALAEACRAAITTSPYASLDAICVVSPAGATAATAGVTIAGAPRQAQTTAVNLNGVRCEFVVDPATNAAAWCAALASSLNAVSPLIDCSAAANAPVVNLTTLDKGSIYNDLDIRPSLLAADQVPGLTIAVTPFTGGTGTHDISAAIAATSNTWYTDIISCFNDATTLADLAAEMMRRYKAMAKLDAHAYYGFPGTYGQTLALSATVNSQFMSCVPASNAQWSPWVAAATFGAACAQVLNNDPARQLRTVELTALAGLAPVDADLYTLAMRNVLLASGMSTFAVASDGTVTIERAVTNYQRSPTGLADTAWQDIMVPKTMTRVRYDWDAYVQETWPNAKLVPDGSIAAQYADGVVTPSVLKASWVARSALYERQGWLENTDTLGAGSVFQINAGNKNRVDSRCPVSIVGNLMDLMTSLQFEV